MYIETQKLHFQSTPRVYYIDLLFGSFATLISNLVLESSADYERSHILAFLWLLVNKWLN